MGRLKHFIYPFLGLSALLWLGMGFGAIFITDFVVENGTEKVVVVTPVGTVGREGSKAPLPVKLLVFPPLPALFCGSYRLAPGESITIQYDMYFRDSVARNHAVHCMAEAAGIDARGNAKGVFRTRDAATSYSQRRTTPICPPCPIRTPPKNNFPHTIIDQYQLSPSLEKLADPPPPTH